VTALFFTFYNQQFNKDIAVYTQTPKADDEAGIDVWCFDPARQKNIPVQATEIPTSWTLKKRKLLDTSEEPILTYGWDPESTLRMERKEFTVGLKRVLAKKSMILKSPGYLIVYINCKLADESIIKTAFYDALRAWQDSIKCEVWAFTPLPWRRTKAPVRIIGNYRFFRIYPKPFSALDFPLIESNNSDSK
jgi:hypothetical protein